MSLFKVKATPVTRLGITAYPIVPEHFDTITSYLNSLPKNNLTYWMSIPMLIYGGNHFFKEIDGYLYLYHLYKNNPELICVPFNKKGEYLSVPYTVDYMIEMDIKKILAVPECSDWFKDVNSIKKYFRIYENGEGYEFIYDNKEMYEMQGGKWKKFRWKIKSFIERNGEPEFISYSPILYHECVSIYERWYTLYQSNNTKPIWDSGFYKDIIKTYPSDTYLIKLKGEFVGFITFVPFTSDTYLEVNRKMLFTNYPNLTQYIQWKQAEILTKKGILYLNDSDDGNFQGLQKFKLSMHPIKKFKNVTLRRD